MGFMDILSRYSDLAPGMSVPQAGQHFEEVAQNAPREDVAQGIAHAFRSDATPEFEQMVGNLFGHSNPEQKAGMLNELLRSLGTSGLGGLAGGPLADLFRRIGAGGQVTPDEAARVDPGAVQDAAAHAARRDPSIIDRLSNFYAQHPALVQTLGNAVLTIALSRMAQRRAA